MNLPQHNKLIKLTETTSITNPFLTKTNLPRYLKRKPQATKQEANDKTR